MRLHKYFLLYCCLGLLGAHIAFSVSLSFITSGLYDNRMINVRHVDDIDWRPSLVRSFLLDNAGSQDRPVVLIAGSSASWGYSFQESVVYPYFMQQQLPEYRIINASVIGDSPLKTLGNLCLADKLGIRVDTLIVEINIANFANQKSNLSESQRARRCVNNKVEESVDSLLPYGSFFFQNPFGLSHLKVIRDEHNYNKNDRKFRFNKVRDGYFDTANQADDTYEAKKSVLLPLLRVSEKVANRVIFFIAPTSGQGVSMSQYKLDDLKYQARRFTELCRSMNDIVCLDARFDMDKAYFSNLTHLNIKGHRFISEYLTEIISPDNLKVAEE